MFSSCMRGAYVRQYMQGKESDTQTQTTKAKLEQNKKSMQPQLRE